MFLSPTKRNVITKNGHQESTRIIHWWVINSAILKMLSHSFLIHRSRLCANIKKISHNLSYQKTSTMLMWCKQPFCVTLLASGSNKSFVRDCQYADFFLNPAVQPHNSNVRTQQREISCNTKYL